MGDKKIKIWCDGHFLSAIFLLGTNKLRSLRFLQFNAFPVSFLEAGRKIEAGR
jgi:hypothetical protein